MNRNRRETDTLWGKYIQPLFSTAIPSCVLVFVMFWLSGAQDDKKEQTQLIKATADQMIRVVEILSRIEKTVSLQSEDIKIHADRLARMEGKK